MSTVVDTSLQLIRARMIQLLLVLVAGLSLHPAMSGAQGLSSEGKEYWIGFMPNYITPAQKIAVYVGTGTPNRIKVETFGDNGMIVRSQSVTLGADKTHRFEMSVGLSETRDRERAVYRAIRVTSTAPCVVYGYSDNSLTTDGYLALPISGYGKEYYCLSYPDDAYSVGYDHLGGEFLIVAPYDATEVTIKTTANTTLTDDGRTQGHKEGDTWKVTLNRGQTYLVQTNGWEWGTNDLTGSRITSTKPVAFLTGHQRASIEQDDGNSKDHLIEMIPPVDRWGTEYFMMPQNSRTKCGDYIRVLSAEDNNQLLVNGSAKQLNAGEWLEISLQTVATTFSSTNNKKFFVMDYSYVEGYNGDPAPGDPFTVSLIPKEQFQKRIIFRTPSNVGNSFKHYATIVYHKDFVGQVTLKKGNNAPTSLSSFGAGSPVPMPFSQYVAQRVQISGDELPWIAEAPTPMGIYLYGYASVESYGWPAGMALKVVSNDPVPPLETRVEDCGDYDVILTETHLMPADTFDDTRFSEVYMIEELNDPNWDKPSFNYFFTLDPKFEVGLNKTSLTLRVIDKTKDAYAAIYAVDQAGNDTVYEYKYEAAKLGATPAPEYVFAPVLVDEDSCIEITLRNDQIVGDVEISAASIMGIARGGRFTVTPTDINTTLKPGETIKLNICFLAEDTLETTDTLIVETECAPFKFALRGEGVIPKIRATDKYFGMIPKGQTRCDDVSVKNEGKYPLKIYAQDLVTNHPDFKINTVQGFSWPITLLPGESQNISFCMTPSQDSGDYAVRITYETNIPARFKEIYKNFSLLSGISRRAGAQLTVLNQGFGPTNCIDRPTYIDTLYNDGQLSKTITKVVIEGPGAASYKIVSSDPPGKILDFVLAPTPKAGGIKYLIQFDPTVAPDETPQEAELLAYTADGAVPITRLSGSRIAPVLTVVAGAPVDYGSIKTNTTKDMTFDVINTGSAVLNVADIRMTGQDDTYFTVVGPKQFTLQPKGGSRTVTVTFAPGAEARAFSAQVIVEPTTPSCTNPQPVNLIAMANTNEYTASGADYATVFTCKDRVRTGMFGNNSTEEDILVTDIQIVGNDRFDFSIESMPNLPLTVLKGGSSFTVPVKFTPTTSGPKQAGLRFTFELEGVQMDTVVPLTGIGDVVPQIMAVGDVAGNVKYTATLDDQLRIPIRLSESFANRNADVRGYSFEVSFKRDAFNFDQAPTGPNNVAITKQFKSHDPVTDMETWTIRTTGLSPNEITLADFAAELNLLPRLHRGLESPIEVANAAWLDANDGVICYIPTTYVPASYQFDPLCGDNALQAYLNDKSIKEIAFGFITPNPVRKDAEINFDVNVDAEITVGIYDALGTEIAKVLDAQPMKVGRHVAKFDASALAEGTYYCRLTNGRTTLTQRLVITK